MTAIVELADTNVESIDGSRESLQKQLESQRQQIESLQQTISALERREQITRLLRESDAIDVEAATLLTEIAIGQMDEPGVEAAVTELRQTRPFLFRAKRARGSGVMSARESDSPRSAAMDRAAQSAAESGSRRDLLRYLRLKRSA